LLDSLLQEIFRMNSPVPPSQQRPPTVDQFVFNGWNITTTKSRIMNSSEESEVLSELELPHLPDMLFVHNSLELQHKEGLTIKFAPVEALKKVNAHEDLIHVSLSKEWLEARKNSPYINKVVHPYDWTFTTNYSGTISEKARIEETTETIDYEKLKIKEKILFFDELVLFEDELDDNGCTKLSCKIRVMPSGFFILLRFYLRVDNNLIRVHDTRLYFQADQQYVLREYSEREAKTENLRVEREVWTDQNLIVEHLPVNLSQNHKIFI